MATPIMRGARRGAIPYRYTGPPDKGRDRKPKETWLQGKLITRRLRGEKGGYREVEQYESEFDPNFRPRTARKTGAGKYQRVDIPEGGNILDMPKPLSFEESLAQGTRADDPRNWEFYYKEPSGRYSPTKGMTARERRSQAFRMARMKAQREAKYAGEDVYETLRAEYETAAIQDQLRRDRMLNAMKRAGTGQFGSTRTARGVARQKILAAKAGVTRQAGRQTAEGAFTGPSRREAADAGTTAARVARQGRRGRSVT